MFPAVWPSENGGWAVIAYRVKAVFQTAFSAVMFAESDFRYEGCKAAAGLFLGKQPFAIAEIVTGFSPASGRANVRCGNAAAVRSKRDIQIAAGGIRRNTRQMSASTSVRQNRAAGRTALPPDCKAAAAAMYLVLLSLRAIVRAAGTRAGSRQIQPRSRHCDVQNWKYRSLFYLLGDGMIFQTASRFECCIYPAQ